MGLLTWRPRHTAGRILVSFCLPIPRRIEFPLIMALMRRRLHNTGAQNALWKT
jgi:hypothetical protein